MIAAETEAGLKARGFRSRIHVRATRNHPLSQRQEEANRKKSRVLARAKIGLQNLVYNIRRLVTLENMAAA
jgi:hypothetical protein